MTSSWKWGLAGVLLLAGRPAVAESCEKHCQEEVRQCTAICKEHAGAGTAKCIRACQSEETTCVKECKSDDEKAR